MKSIVLDVDGVILDFNTKYLDLAREIFKKEINPNLNKYELKDFLNVHEEENKLVWDEFNNKNCWKNINPLEGAKEAIQAIVKSGMDIYVVSSVDSCNYEARMENLKEVGLSPKKLFCVGGNHSPKNEVISEIKPIAFIDDRLDHLFKSKDVPHLAWVDHNHNQYVEEFEELSVKVKSLKEWTDKYLSLIMKGS